MKAHISLYKDDTKEPMTSQTFHVLLIEANPRDTRLIRSLLAEVPSANFTWEYAEELSSATEILRNEPFDLVLLDLSLPDSQGLDTFSHLYPHAICLPIVVLTTTKDEALALQAVQLGAQDYLVKGQMESELVARALRHAVQRKANEIALHVKIRELTTKTQQLESAVRISHDLSNALTALSLRIETLLEQIPVNDIKHTDLQMVQDEVNRMGRLVARLLPSSHRGPLQAKLGVSEEVKDTPDLVQYLQDHKIITINDNETYFFQPSEVGTAGYILRGASINELVAMIHNLIHEGVQIPQTLDPGVLHDYLEQIKAGGVPSYEELSPREREVIRLIARGRTNKEIGKRLSISVRTVERHRSSIMNKLGLQNRAELVAYAVQQGLLSGSDAK
jgi:DNA-binding NarL/FixJ family response regulator